MDYIILALATWRLTSLLVFEDGPGDVFLRFRAYVGVYKDYAPCETPGVFAKALVCPACVSVWMGLVWAIAYLVSDNATWIALPFALSAMAILIENLTGIMTRNG